MLEHFRHLTDATSAKRSFLSAFGAPAAPAATAEVADGTEQKLAQARATLPKDEAAPTQARALPMESPMAQAAAQDDDGAGQASHAMTDAQVNGGYPDQGGPSTLHSATRADSSAVLRSACLAPSEDDVGIDDAPQPAPSSNRVSEPLHASKSIAGQPPAASSASQQAAPPPGAEPTAFKRNNGRAVGGTGGSVQQLRAVLGDDVTYGAALQLLQASQGSVEAAVNAFYDPSGTSAPGASASKAANVLPAAGEAGAAPIADANVDDGPLYRRCDSPAPANDSAKATRTPAKASAMKPAVSKGAGKRASSGKKGAAASPAKLARAITAFFASPRGTGVAPAPSAAPPASRAVSVKEQAIAGPAPADKSGHDPTIVLLDGSDDDVKPEVASLKPSEPADAAASDQAHTSVKAEMVGAEFKEEIAVKCDSAGDIARAAGAAGTSMALVGGAEAAGSALEHALLPVDKCAPLCLQQCCHVLTRAREVLLRAHASVAHGFAVP